MLRNVQPSFTITRKEALFIVSRYFGRLPKEVRKGIIKDMLELKLLRDMKARPRRYEIINLEKSSHIDAIILFRVIQGYQNPKTTGWDTGD